MLYEFKESDAFNFARHIGARTRKKNDELVFTECPYCKSRKDKETFSISLRTGQFKCLRASCGITGNMITLARDFDFSLNKDVDEYYFHKTQYRHFKTPEKMPEPTDKVLSYLKERGISKETAEKYQLTKYANRDDILVFPFLDEKGKMQFVKYRDVEWSKDKTINGKDGKEYKAPKEWCEKGCKPILFGMAQCNLENKRLVITEGQCFEGDAEIMTRNGWCRFEDYSGQDVLQVHDDLSGSFTTPKRHIIKRHIGNMIEVSIGGNYYTATTDDHNLVFQDRNGKLLKKMAGEKISAAYHIPTTINFDEKSFSWSNDMIALFLAVSADGTLDYRKNTGYKKAKSNVYARFGLTKERKVVRLIEILKSLNIEYSDNILTSGKGKEYHSICFPCPEWLDTKYIPWSFATATSIEQKKYIVEEMVHWDGNHVNGRNQYEYMSIIKHNADVIQAVASMCGYMSTIMKKSSGGNGNFKKGFTYKVSILLSKKNVSTQQFEQHKVVKAVDKTVYCVTVETGMLLVRQKGCISVSGNCDTLAVAESGIENVVSVPTGAKGFTWIPHCWNWWCGFEELVVFGDCEKGHITLLDELSKRFPGKVKHVCKEDYKDCKDANEILLKYGKEQVRKCVENAECIPIKQVKQLADVKKRDLKDIPKMRTGFRYIDNMIGGYLYGGQLVILTGKRGQGKSTIANEICVSAIKQGKNVFAYSGELPDWQYKNWIDFAIAGPQNIVENELPTGEVQRFITNSNQDLIDDWYRDKFYLYDNNCIDDDELTDLITTITNAIMQYGIDLVIIDNLMTALDVDLSKDEFRSQSKFIKKLQRLCKKLDVIIVLVAHPKKNAVTSDANDAVSGSGDITNAADIVMTFKRDAEEENHNFLKISKNRWFGMTHKEKEDGIDLWYDKKSRRLSGKGMDVNRTVGWEQKIQQESFDDGFVTAEATPFD